MEWGDRLKKHRSDPSILLLNLECNCSCTSPQERSRGSLKAVFEVQQIEKTFSQATLDEGLSS